MDSEEALAQMFDLVKDFNVAARCSFTKSDATIEDLLSDPLSPIMASVFATFLAKIDDTKLTELPSPVLIGVFSFIIFRASSELSMDFSFQTKLDELRGYYYNNPKDFETATMALLEKARKCILRAKLQKLIEEDED